MTFVDLPLAAAALEQRGIGIAGGDQLGPRIEPDRRHMVIIADAAGADARDSNPDYGPAVAWKECLGTEPFVAKIREIRAGNE